MEKVTASKTIARLRAGATEELTTLETFSEQTKDVTRYIFARLTGHYLNFSVAMEDETVAELTFAEWNRVTCKLTPDEIETGLNHLSGAFPPSAGDFKKLCRINSGWRHGGAVSV